VFIVIRCAAAGSARRCSGSCSTDRYLRVSDVASIHGREEHGHHFDANQNPWTISEIDRFQGLGSKEVGCEAGQ
jgi:hypothetical protein